MATTADYLAQLQVDKQTLVDNLVAKGVEASSDETFTTLAPKVADISSGGIDEYFDLTPRTSGGIGTYIKIIPLIDTSGYTSMRQMFQYHYKLVSMPQLDTSNVTDMYSMCAYCESLEELPLLNTSKVTNMSGMFRGCKNLKSLPSFDTSNVTTISTMCQECSSLKIIPELDASKVVNIGSNAFYGNSGLTDFGGLKNLGMAYLSTVSANYSNYTFDLIHGKNLTYDSLMNVINNLYDIASIGVQTQTLRLASEHKTKLTAEEIAIATNKGWTVS